MQNSSRSVFWLGGQIRLISRHRVFASHGGVVEGERMLVGYIQKPKGTGARMHTHPNEQFNFVLKGTLHGSVDGHDFVAPQGTLIYIPADTPHTISATQEEDVIFLAIKDLSHGIIGTAVDGTMDGALYDPGFEPGATKA
jgi:quercetin dioxygenase-like cupin family protein